MNLKSDILEKKTAILINLKAGYFARQFADTRQQELRQLFSTMLPDARIIWSVPHRLSEIFSELKASDFEYIIVGGGDGTLHLAANHFAKHDKIMGILPMGTFNLIARDLRIPISVKAALDILINGTVQHIDVGEINNHLIFLHNVSVGIHPHAVEKREIYRKRLKISKALAIGYALLETIWHPPKLKLNLITKEDINALETPFIFIGSSLYDTDTFAFLHRKSLNNGLLSLFYTHEMKNTALFKMALRTLVYRRLKYVPDLEKRWTEAVTLMSENRKLKLVADGEIIQLAPPITFCIRHDFLQMIVPSEQVV